MCNSLTSVLPQVARCHSATGLSNSILRRSVPLSLNCCGVRLKYPLGSCSSNTCNERNLQSKMSNFHSGPTIQSHVTTRYLSNTCNYCNSFQNVMEQWNGSFLCNCAAPHIFMLFHLILVIACNSEGKKCLQQATFCLHSCRRSLILLKEHVYMWRCTITQK